MASKVLDLLTICGLSEIAGHGERRVSHVLSILDPETPDPDFAGYPVHRRTVLRFHDIIDPTPGMVAPTAADVDAILAFGRSLEDGTPAEGHLLVHCHMGISRSTAAMAMILAQAHPDEPEAELLGRIATMRAQAWPNLLMIELADARLGRGGRLREAAVGLYRRSLAASPQFGDSLTRLGRAREIEAARTAAA